MEKENKDMQQECAALMRVEGMYDPAVETYVFEDISLVCKVEKILVVNTGKEIQLRYVCVNEFGQRELFDPNDFEEDFKLTLDRCITEYTFKGLLDKYEEDYLFDILPLLFDGLRIWEVKGVKKSNGIIESLDDYYEEWTNGHRHDDDEEENVELGS